MNLIEKFTEDEKYAMERYIDDYASEYSTRSVGIEYILREWNETKADLFKMMGENFIIEKPVMFKKGPEELCDELYKKFCPYKYVPKDELNDSQKFLRAYMDDFVNPLREAGDWLTISRLEGLVDFYRLATNFYEDETFEIIPVGCEKAIKIQHGCKITRVLGKIAQAAHLPHFEEFRILHSQVLNQKMLKGRLCLSIHPLDYMTMSDNDCDWNSCMSWQNVGCYRQGTVEMMNSPCVVVAYLRSDEDMYLASGDFPWSNKKWRELYIVTPEMIGNIKSYPYTNENLTKATLDWLKELADTDTFTDEIIEYVPFEGFDFNNKVISIQPRTNHMYNDFSHSRKQFAYLNKNLKEYYTFNYSGKSECMLCGELNPYFPNDEALVGECCERIGYCDYCGDSYDPDDLTEVDGEYLCPYCVETECGRDAIDGKLHRLSDMTSIYFGNEECFCYNDSINIFNLPAVLTDGLNIYFKRLRMITQWYSKEFYVTEDDLTEKGKRLFYNLDYIKDCLNRGKNYFQNREFYIDTDVKEEEYTYWHWYKFLESSRSKEIIYKVYSFN